VGLIGVMGTVIVGRKGGSLVVTVPSKALQDLLIAEGDTLLVRVTGKDLKYRKVE